MIEVGERTYRSKFSGQDEKQPISVMILGPRGKRFLKSTSRDTYLTIKGSDDWLMGCLDKVWKESGRPSSVKVGTSMF